MVACPHTHRTLAAWSSDCILEWFRYRTLRLHLVLVCKRVTSTLLASGKSWPLPNLRPVERRVLFFCQAEAELSDQNFLNR